MTAGVPSGQQDLDDFHNESLLNKKRCLSARQKRKPIGTRYAVHKRLDVTNNIYV